MWLVVAGWILAKGKKSSLGEAGQRGSFAPSSHTWAAQQHMFGPQCTTMAPPVPQTVRTLWPGRENPGAEVRLRMADLKRQESLAIDQPRVPGAFQDCLHVHVLKAYILGLPTCTQGSTR